MRRGKTLSVLLLTFLCLFFQNCVGKSTAEAAQPATQLATTKVEKISVGNDDLKKITVRVVDIRTMKTETHEYSMKTYRLYEIDLKSGVVRQTWDDDGERIDPDRKNCFSKDLQGKIVKLILDYQICRTEIYRSNLACTQVVRPAYAELSTKKETFKLQSASDPCATSAENLCGEGETLLKNLVTKIDWKRDVTACK